VPALGRASPRRVWLDPRRVGRTVCSTLIAPGGNATTGSRLSRRDGHRRIGGCGIRLTVIACLSRARASARAAEGPE